MQNQPSIRTAVEADLSNLTHDEVLWQSILSEDLSVVTKTFAERHPDYATKAEDLELECKRFLYLAAIAPNFALAPTKPIDEYWHMLILFTEEYSSLCSRFHGFFVHHKPLGDPDQTMLFKRTQEMVSKLFGNFRNRDFWFLPQPATSCSSFCTAPIPPYLRQ